MTLLASEWLAIQAALKVDADPLYPSNAPGGVAFFTAHYQWMQRIGIISLCPSSLQPSSWLKSLSLHMHAMHPVWCLLVRHCS